LKEKAMKKPLVINGKEYKRGKNILKDWDANPNVFEAFFGLNKQAFAAIMLGASPVETEKTKKIKY